MEKVSVIVPVYNAEKYLEECVESILNQTYTNIEVILIEDYSLDSSFSILAKYQTDPRVILLHNNKNYGVGYSRNRGIDVASGEYLTFVDSDDVLEIEALEKLVFSLEKSNTDMSMCDYHTFYGKIPSMEKRNSFPFEVIDIEENPILLDKCGGACWAKLFRKSLFDSFRFPEGIIYEDAPVTFPLMIKARKIAFVNEALYHYRFNLNGITKSDKKRPNLSILDIYSAALLLDHNYQLVRRNDFLDIKMRELGYNILFLGALNSGFWFQMKKRKALANAFYALANGHYGYTSYHDSAYLERRIKEVPLFAIRMKYLSTFVFKRKFQLEKGEEEQLEEIKKYIEEYLFRKKNKCKVKKK